MQCWNPELYASNSLAQKNWGLELLQKLSLKGDEKVLDIGCGDGKLSAEIASRLPKGSVLGIDMSEDMVKFAREHYPGKQFQNLTFRQADAKALSFESEFDIIFSNAALHWITEHAPMLAGFRKSLKPGGKLLVQMGGKGNAAEIFIVLDSMLKTEKWKPFFTEFTSPYGFYGPEEYGQWLKASGFFPQRLELLKKDMVIKGKKGLSAWIASTWHPYTLRVPEELREDFVYEIVELFAGSHPPDEQGNLHVQMVRLEVEANVRV
jgi:trans-aconitate 2-methyltransferase